MPPAGYAGSGAPVPQSDPTRRPCLALVSGRHTQRQRLTMPVPPHNRQQLQPLAYRRRPCIRADLRTWPASRHHHQHHHQQQQPAGESLRVNPWGSFVISFTVPRHERCAVRASCLAVCGAAGRDRPRCARSLPTRGIPGVAPSIVNPPSGCAFHLRCPQAEDRFSREEPAEDVLSSGHRVRCHFAREDRPEPAATAFAGAAP